MNGWNALAVDESAMEMDSIMSLNNSASLPARDQRMADLVSFVRAMHCGWRNS